jgi:hypothetical protein
MQLMVVMAGLDPAIHALTTTAGDIGNCVDARVKPAHDDLRLVPDQNRTTHFRSPESPAIEGEGFTQ